MTVMKVGRRVCGASCHDARNLNCRCVCEGKNHGLGLAHALGIEARRREKEMKHARYVVEEQTDAKVVIRDLGPWNEHLTVTNDVAWVVQDLVQKKVIGAETLLLYWDSEGNLDEIEHDGEGRFLAFAPVE